MSADSSSSDIAQTPPPQAAAAAAAVAAADGDVVANPTFWNYIGFWFPHIFVLGYVGVILAAMSTQFIGGEFPCPLCMIQRMAMVLGSICCLWIIGRARNGTLTMSRYMAAYGFAILSVLFGATVSARQILLHVIPPDPGYGGTVLGLHLYTWAFITFIIVIIYCAFMMIFSRSTFPVAPPTKGLRMVSTIIIAIFLLVVAANLVSIFFEEGMHWYLPDDPECYALIDNC